MIAKPPLKAKLGIAPIAWWNDDLAELSDGMTLEECQGWFVVEAEQDPKISPPLEMAQRGQLLSVMAAVGYEVAQ